MFADLAPEILLLLLAAAFVAGFIGSPAMNFLHGRVDRDRQVELIQNELSRRLAHFLVSEGMVRVAELPHEWDLEFRLDLQVLGPKAPDPDSEENFIYRPFDGRDRP